MQREILKRKQDKYAITCPIDSSNLKENRSMLSQPGKIFTSGRYFHTLSRVLLFLCHWALGRAAFPLDSPPPHRRLGSSLSWVYFSTCQAKPETRSCNHECTFPPSVLLGRLCIWLWCYTSHWVHLPPHWEALCPCRTSVGTSVDISVGRKVNRGLLIFDCHNGEGVKGMGAH